MNAITSSPPTSVATAQLALVLTPGLGPQGQLRLLQEFGSAEAACGATAAQWRAAGVRVSRRAQKAPDSDDVAEAVNRLTRAGAAVLDWTCEDYPTRLRQISDPPPFLFVRGDIRFCHLNTIAIVGARRASGYGRRIAAHLATRLAAAGFVIVSGLALGIDAAAHQGALSARLPTVAVTACGPERIYPRRHLELAKAVEANGAIVTEFAPGTPPLPRHFPRRNRIISGLCLGVVIVEAGERSGSLITARLALEQGREVFAVPGAVTNPLARGTHQLLRDGARLVADAGDVLDELGAQLAVPFGLAGAIENPNLSTQALRVLRELNAHPSSADMLSGNGIGGIREVSAALQELALLGLVEKQVDGLWGVR